MSITGGTFHEEVEGVLAGDDHAVVLVRHRFIRDGSPKDYRTAYVYEVSNGIAQTSSRAGRGGAARRARD
jgi:hypothetical protein